MKERRGGVEKLTTFESMEFIAKKAILKAPAMKN